MDYEAVLKILLDGEALVTYMYLDTHKPRPLVTVGIGNMLPDAAAAQRLPFINTAAGRPATKDEIADAYDKVASLREQVVKAKHGWAAHLFKHVTSMELTKEFAKELAISRLKKEFVPGLRRLFSGFDSYPVPAKEALIDMAYNSGIGRREKIVEGKVTQKATGLANYSMLIHAAESGDWLVAAKECGVNGASSENKRIAWRRAQFEDAARIVADRSGM